MLGPAVRQGIATTTPTGITHKGKGNPKQTQHVRKKKLNQSKQQKQPKQAKAKNSAPAKSKASAGPPFILPATLPPTDALYLLDTYQLESPVTMDAPFCFASVRKRSLNYWWRSHILWSVGNRPSDCSVLLGPQDLRGCNQQNDIPCTGFTPHHAHRVGV